MYIKTNLLVLLLFVLAFSKIKTHLIEDLRNISLSRSTMDLRRMKLKASKKFDMDKRIRPNPKYENVQAQVNTGNNTRKQLEK